MVVNDAAAPFQSGLSGSVAILSKTGTMPLGVPAAGDFSVASVGTNGALFGVTKGGTLADGTASPSCRVALPLYNTSPQYLTSAGWQLIDSAVTWATNC